MTANDTVAAGESTIRALVHKHRPENVFLADIRAVGGGDQFLCTGRIPTHHSLFNDGGRAPAEDVLFYTEVGRQASLAMTHAFLDVSLDDIFIFERSEAAVMDAIWRLPKASRDVAIEIAIREIVRRKNDAVCRVVADHVMAVGNEQVFRGTGTWTIQSPALFTRLRRAARDSAQSSSGRSEYWRPMQNDARNVAVSTPEFGPDDSTAVASLIVDRTHPYFFDHPCDHVPGMLLLEGCAQLALETFAAFHGTSKRTVVMAYDVNFTQFVECDRPTTLTARLICDHGTSAGAHNVEISMRQQGSLSGTAIMTIGLSN